MDKSPLQRDLNEPLTNEHFSKQSSSTFDFINAAIKQAVDMIEKTSESRAQGFHELNTTNAVLEQIKKNGI